MEGDLVSLDLGIFYQGFHTDAAYTFWLGKPFFYFRKDPFLLAGRKALEEAIESIKPGKNIGDISEAIQRRIEGAGFSCIASLTGHGIGRKLHAKPSIPCLLVVKKEETPPIRSGMALAIEIIYAEGRPEIITAEDGWTISTKDGKMAALFEKTVFVKQSKAEVLTPYIWEENARK